MQLIKQIYTSLLRHSEGHLLHVSQRHSASKCFTLKRKRQDEQHNQLRTILTSDVREGEKTIQPDDRRDLLVTILCGRLRRGRVRRAHPESPTNFCLQAKSILGGTKIVHNLGNLTA